MDVRLLRYFVAVAEELNVTRAAEKLHTSQPSLSQQIRQLEGIFRALLFHREKHRLKLTDAGHVLLPMARSILESVDDALAQVRAAAQSEDWTISLGMIPGPEGKIFSHLLPHLLRYHPNIQLLLKSMTAPEQIEALLKHDIAAGFLRGPIENDQIASEVFMREEVVVVLPEDCELAEMDRVPVSELAQKMKFISSSAKIAPAVHNVGEEIQKRGGVKFEPGFCAESLMTSLNAVASGLGFSFFAAYVAEVVPKGVVTRPIDLDPSPYLDLLFAYRIDNRLPALMKLVSLVQEFAPFQRERMVTKTKRN